MQTERAGPLHDVRVVDLTRALSGPYCTMILGDLGADVIKVETPPFGDELRLLGPYTEVDDEHAFGGYFASNNRNKRSVLLDLDDEEGRTRFRKLVDRADVVVENYRPGVMEARGLGYETLRDGHEALVYCAIRGFGDPRSGASPSSSWPSYDIVAQAMGGLVSHTGTIGGEEVAVGASIGDLYPGTMAVIGILGALHHATATGEGQFVDVGMVDCIVSLCESMLWRYSYSGERQAPTGTENPWLSPFEVFPTRDSGVAIAAPQPSQWAELCRAIGRDDLVDDDRTRSARRRVINRPLVQEAVGSWTSARTTAEVMAALGGQVPCGPVNDAAALVVDEHVRARSMLVAIEHAGSRRPVVVANTPLRFSATPGGVHRRAPRLGEHSEEALREAEQAWTASRSERPPAPPAGPMHLVVGTGRCGSTMLSRMLGLHPDVLSVSEFFALVKTTHTTFLVDEVSGEAFWDTVSAANPFVDAIVRAGLPVPELRYPYATGRFTEAGVPRISHITLAMLSDDPDALFDQLEAEVPTWPVRPAGEHYTALFGLLAGILGRRVVVERSGASLGMLPLMLDTFPGARFVHMHRSGPDCALSMSRHATFRMAAIARQAAKDAGLGTLADIEFAELLRRAPREAALITPPFDREAIMGAPIPAAVFGEAWSDEVQSGIASLEAIPADRRMDLAYEDLLADPAGELRRLAEHLGVAPLDGWLQECSGIVDRRRQGAATQLASEDVAALAAACAPGEAALRALNQSQEKTSDG